MQGLPNNIKGRYTCWSRADDRIAFPGPLGKLLKPGTGLKECKRLPGPGNPIDIEEEW